MPEYDETDDELEPQAETPNVRQMRERIKALEEEAKGKAELEQKVAQMERETIFLSDPDLARLNPSQRKALEAVTSGEVSIENFRASATDLGFVAAPPPATTPAEQAAHQRISQAAAGDAAPTLGNEAALDARLAEARSEAEFDRIYRESGRPTIDTASMSDASWR